MENPFFTILLAILLFLAGVAAAEVDIYNNCKEHGNTNETPWFVDDFECEVKDE